MSWNTNICRWDTYHTNTKDGNQIQLYQTVYHWHVVLATDADIYSLNGNQRDLRKVAEGFPVVHFLFILWLCLSALIMNVVIHLESETNLKVQLYKRRKRSNINRINLPFVLITSATICRLIQTPWSHKQVHSLRFPQRVFVFWRQWGMTHCHLHQFSSQDETQGMSRRQNEEPGAPA